MRASPRRAAPRSGVPVSSAPAIPTARDRAALWLGRVAFCALLLVVGMRPLLSETYESSEGMFAEYVRGAEVATPATTGSQVICSVWT